MTKRMMRAGPELSKILKDSGLFPLKHKHDHTRDAPIVITRTINGHEITCTCTRESRCFDYAGWALGEVRRWKIDGKPSTKSQVWSQFGEECSPAVIEQNIGRVGRDGQTDSDEGSDPVLADILGLKRGQLEGVRDPDAELIERLEGGEGNVKRLAQSYLDGLGVK